MTLAIPVAVVIWRDMLGGVLSRTHSLPHGTKLGHLQLHIKGEETGETFTVPKQNVSTTVKSLVDNYYMSRVEHQWRI